VVVAGERVSARAGSETRSFRKLQREWRGSIRTVADERAILSRVLEIRQPTEELREDFGPMLKSKPKETQDEFVALLLRDALETQEVVSGLAREWRF
jgi:hypothetical protein